ncbi:MAG: aspartate-semialdehyde dehydrogenase [Anaerolineae bacterium]|jgi:aspartate-semialdehyde dehydrogenase|nr:aspartate-semialdehyde dehydrogenase [Chloroflexota bacterium]
MEPLPVGVLGATGAVGQRFIQLLARNPWFRITALAASERSAGRRFGEACDWRLSTDCPEQVRDMVIQPVEPGLDCAIVFSALPASAAQDAEERFAAAGYGVFSNASSHRMEPDVPLLIPEVNGDHAQLIQYQQARRGWDKGFIVTNPNCSTVGLVLALKPLHDAFGVERVLVTTMQAVSGAGYPGVPSLDVLDGVVPYIGGEEEKMVQEPLKLLGSFDAASGTVRPASITISASCNRVAVRDGHMEAVSVALATAASTADVVAALTGFKSRPHALGCPSATDPTILVRDEPDRPQPFRDRENGQGMAVTVGRVRPCPVLGHKMMVLSHNTIRGAAGGSILNAELLRAQGVL